MPHGDATKAQLVGSPSCHQVHLGFEARQQRRTLSTQRFAPVSPLALETSERGEFHDRAYQAVGPCSSGQPLASAYRDVPQTSPCGDRGKAPAMELDMTTPAAIGRDRAAHDTAPD